MGEIIHIYMELIYMIVMLISCRVHYSIDVIGGIIFSLFFYKISENLVFYFDYFWSIPYLGYKKYRNQNEDSDNILIE